MLGGAPNARRPSVRSHEGTLAERVGFEPTVGFTLRPLSKRVPSASRSPLRARSGAATLPLYRVPSRLNRGARPPRRHSSASPGRTAFGGRTGVRRTTRFGTSRFGTTRFGTARLGTTGLGTTRRSTADLGTTGFSTTGFGTTCFSATCFGATGLDTTGLDTTGLGTARVGTTRVGTTRFGTTRVGATRLVTARPLATRSPCRANGERILVVHDDTPNSQ